jgi:TRAP transporter TAXI family solute receptor
MEEHSNRLRLSPKPYSDWIGALALTSEGQEDLVTSWAHNCFQAQNDIKKFAEDGDIGPVDPKPQMTLPVIHQGFWWVGTHADRDDIETIGDLDGKKVATQLPGAAPSTWFESCLNEAGASPDQLSFMPFPDAASAMQSRNIDASLFLAINGAIVPAPTQQAFQAVDIKGVSIPDDVLETIKQNEWQTMQWAPVRNENFNVKAAPVEKFEETTAFLMASGNHIRSTADPDLVYDYVKNILENQDTLGEYHAALKATGIGEGRHNFEGTPEGLQFHEGAVQYYEEEGIDYPGSGN